MKNSSLIVLSTMSKEYDNMFMKLKHSGLFKVTQNTYACMKCIRDRKIDSCKHNLDVIPHYNDPDRIEKIRELNEDDEDTRNLETMGIELEQKSGCVFPENHLSVFFDKTWVSLINPLSYLFVAVDPCAGSDQIDASKRPSDLAIMTIGMPGRVLVGIDSIPANNLNDAIQAIQDHITGLRRREPLKTATIVLDVEHGSGLVVSSIYDVVSKMDSHVIQMHDFTRVDGRRMNNKGKVKMASLTGEYLREGAFSIYNNIYTRRCDEMVSKKSGHTPNKLKHDILAQFKIQMGRYKRVSDGHGIKLSGKGPGTLKDDMAVAFQRCVLAIEDFYTDERYRKYLI